MTDDFSVEYCGNSDDYRVVFKLIVKCRIQGEIQDLVVKKATSRPWRSVLVISGSEYVNLNLGQYSTSIYFAKPPCIPVIQSLSAG